MPMQRWIARAAGGTNQRLNPGPATIRSRSSRPPLRPGNAVGTAVVLILASLVLMEAIPSKWTLHKPFRKAHQGLRLCQSTIRAHRLHTRLRMDRQPTLARCVACQTAEKARSGSIKRGDKVTERSLDGWGAVAHLWRSGVEKNSRGESGLTHVISPVSVQGVVSGERVRRRAKRM